MAIEDFDFKPESYDIVLSSLAFHYLELFEDLCRKIHSCLTKHGNFVFSVEHPVFTAYGNWDWYYNEYSERLHGPVDRYFTEGKRMTCFLGEEIIKYHKTLTTYVRGIYAGFEMTDLVEPEPDKTLLEIVPGMIDELRRPTMLIVAAIKNDFLSQRTKIVLFVDYTGLLK